MIIDKEDHRVVLLEAVRKVFAPGDISEMITEIKEAIRQAAVATAPESNKMPRPTAGQQDPPQSASG